MSNHPTSDSSKGRGHGGARRGYSWKPFGPGNTAALVHGARTEALIVPLATLARDELVARCPWLEAPAFSAAIEAWSRAEARVVLVDRFLAKEGILDENGVPRPAADLLVRLERQATDLRGRLGLDPTNAARLQRDLAASASGENLERLAAEGRKIMDRRGLEAGASEANEPEPEPEAESEPEPEPAEPEQESD